MRNDKKETKPILLLRPPYEYTPTNDTPSLHLPLGLLYIATPLINSGYEVTLIDGLLPRGNIDSWKAKGGSLFFDVNWDDIEKALKHLDFDIAGISGQFSIQYRNVRLLAKLVKYIKPGCKIVIGGADATVRHRQILEDAPEIDAVIRGEGEVSFLQFVDNLYLNKSLSTITGLSWRDGDKIVENSNHVPITPIDNVPLPAYEIIDMDRYLDAVRKFPTRTRCRGRTGITVITSRGCPFQCVFCSVHLHMGRRWRGHSPQYVLRHIELLVTKYKIKYFHFEDDDLTSNPGRFEKILDLIIEKNLDIWWDTPNGVRADSFTQNLMDKCRISGCKFLIFGVESGSQRILDTVINKKLQLSDVEKACSYAKRSGVNSRAFFIMGLPGEKKRDMVKTAWFMIKLALKYNTFSGAGSAVPLYGTELYKIVKKRRYLEVDVLTGDFPLAYTEKWRLRTEDFDSAFPERIIKITGKILYYLEIMVFFKRILHQPLLIR
ncbi:MAG: B12-binding domain-containing radical SAM protein, partial [Planctomycetes bacterium]|nr:B12-binding domain-containing radical SAM protein [Planctomycetota bacterium]